LGRGTFLDVSRSAEGRVRKRFRFPLAESTAKSFLDAHERYVSRLSSCINMPQTRAEAKPMEDGSFQVDIHQDDLSQDGCDLASFLKCDLPVSVRIGAFSQAMRQTLQVRAEPTISIESNPNNWWIREDRQAVFFDTTPPLLLDEGKPRTELLVMKENPTFMGRLTAFLAHNRITAKLSAMVIKDYAFSFPTLVRTFLIKSIDAAPKLKGELIEAARSAVAELDLDDEERKRFEAKLSDFSIGLEMLKLRVFKFIDSLG